MSVLGVSIVTSYIIHMYSKFKRETSNKLSRSTVKGLTPFSTLPYCLVGGLVLVRGLGPRPPSLP